MDFLKGLVDSKKRGLEGPHESGSGPKKWKRKGDIRKEEEAKIAEVTHGLKPFTIFLVHFFASDF